MVNHLKCESKDCPNIPEFSIRYDVGSGPDQVLVLCRKHYESNEVFQRNIKKIKEIKN